MNAPLTLDPETFHDLMALVQEHGSVDTIRRALAAKPAVRRQTVAFNDAGQVLTAYELKLITKEEARRLLGLTRRRAVRKEA